MFYSLYKGYAIKILSTSSFIIYTQILSWGYYAVDIVWWTGNNDAEFYVYFALKMQNAAFLAVRLPQG